jgi:hypothetical protein
MWPRRFQSAPDAHALQACAGLALACTYSSSDEYEAELIHARRSAGAYGPRRHRPLVLVMVATLIALAAAALLATTLAN